MRLFILAGLLFASFFIISCSKNSNALSNSIVGTWRFTHQITFSNPYPTVLRDPNPIAYSSWTISSDSIDITFDNSGNYTFSNFRLPLDKGHYSIVQDSLLVIKPDTAAFVKFNYTMPTLVFSTGTTVNQPLPYVGFRFTSDTVVFKKTDNTIIFTSAWLAKADNPIIPSGDTLLANQIFNFFTRK